MITGREQLEKIKEQVKKLARLKVTNGKEVVKLRELVKGFPKGGRELYHDRINQITKRYL